MEPGRELGPYQIVEPIGAGGMGEVYRAHDSNLRRDVAIKLLSPQLSDDAGRLARLQREARTLASLNHPNIATVHGFEEHDGTRFIVMELVEGETLAQKLEAGPLTGDEALELACQIARGLEAAHDRGIVHRDLKPGNVKVTPGGQVKLLDFGLAKSLPSPDDGVAEGELPTATVDVTRAGVVMGTASYMSPEQARGGTLDGRTDVWAFGCLLYEMLSGKKAFGGGSASDILAGVLRDEPDWDALPTHVPRAVRRLVRRTLKKEPEDRLRHVGDARLELEEALEDLSTHGSRPVAVPVSGPETAGARDASGAGAPGSTSAAPGSERGPSAGPARSSGDVFRKGAVVVVAATALIGGWYLLGSGEPEITDRSIAVLPFETLGREETTTFTDGIHADMLTRLSKLSGLSVTSRTSVMRFREPDRPLPEIARELGVTWVLQGEVQESGDQVQVNARLVNALEDRQVWTESYRRTLTAENLFRIQGEVTKRIAEQLQARLSPAERRALERTPTADLEAYHLYVRGREHLEQRTEDNMRQAADYFQGAIARDAGYAPAWAGLADALVLLEWYGYDLPESAPEPEDAVRRALELGPELGEAHTSMGILRSTRQEGPAMIRELERAVELRPSYAEGHIWLAWARLLVGRPRAALEAAERALELDPLAPAVRVFLAEACLANGKLEEALRHARRGRELQPEYGLAHFIEGLVLYHLGRDTEAVSALMNARSLVPARGAPTHSEVRAALAVIHAVAGDENAARDLLARIDDAADPFSAGLVRAALGETDAAFAAFERVTEWGSFSMEHLRYFFPEVLASVREDSRFGELLRRVNRSWGVNE